MDLFSLEEPLYTSLREKPFTDDDPDTMKLQAGLIKEQVLEIVVMHLRNDDELWKAREHERMRGVSPSSHALTTEEATRQLMVAILSQ